MLLLAFFSLALQFRSAHAQLDANGISLAEKVLAIEQLMLVPGTIDFQVAPCDFVLNGPPNNSPDISGDQTAAQWVRTVFHDFITANVAAGTGGLDASLLFEMDRPENLGAVFNNGATTLNNFADRTVIGFNLFTSLFISTSDFIALGLAEAILSCDPNSPMMELRAGRIDALAAGPSGVPGPADSFASQKAQFARAGFSQTEMITAVACGHSIGGVHGVNFPEVVGSQPTVGSSEVDYFDDTPFVFDNTGVKNYLSGAGKAGGPLVTTTNVTVQSDLRIFTSDKNVTIKAIATSQSTFEAACLKVFAKMVNTVPAGVTLSAPIGPRKFITMYSFVELSPTGVLSYIGQIGGYSKTAAPATVSYTYKYMGGSTTTGTTAAGAPQTMTVNFANGAQRFPFFGNTTFWTFSDTITSTATTFSIGTIYTEPINTRLFIVPSLSFKNSGLGSNYLVRAALQTSLYSSGATLTATLYYSTSFPGTTSPVYAHTTARLTKWKVIGAYTIFSGTVTRGSEPDALGDGHFLAIDVKLGTTQRSTKIQVVGSIGKTDMFASCDNADLTTC